MKKQIFPVRQLKLIIVLSIFICWSQKIYAHKFEHPNTWNNPKIIKILETSKIVGIKPMKDALTEQGKKIEFEGKVFLITLKNNVKAVFKSIPIDDQGDAMAEVAAYKASLRLGFPYVPPTVLRNVHDMKGSLQLFVDTPIDLLQEREFEKYSKKFKKKDWNNLKVFYFVFGQWDSGAHNLLAYSSQSTKAIYPIAIDNSGIRNHQHVRYSELPFVRVIYSEKLNTNDWIKPFPFEGYKIIHKPSHHNLKKTFGNKLPESFYQNFQSYGKPLKYVVYQNSVWRQYHAFDKNFVKSYTKKCSQKALSALQKLDLKTLKEIFWHAKGNDFLTNSYLKSILERRDQVVKSHNAAKDNKYYRVPDISIPSKQSSLR
jgi:hypothetical protein